MLQKLTSRKFISALVGVISGIILIINKNTTEGTSVIISSILGYMLTEGYIDAKAAAALNQAIEEVKEDKE